MGAIGLRRKADPGSLIAELRRLSSEAESLGQGAGGSRQQMRQEYLIWTESVEQLLEHFVAGAELAEALRSERYWRPRPRSQSRARAAAAPSQ